MMLYPSIDELLDKVPSKYSLIILASKRAHEIRLYDNGELENYQSVKAVGQALEEVVADSLQIGE